MFDLFIEKYRWYIGLGLIVVIVGGLGLIYQDKLSRQGKEEENSRLAELTKQNDELRQELSKLSAGQVAGESVEQEGDKIDINTADAAELDKLPGIGPVRAADIIAYRESHGVFKSIEEIKNIKGIGDKSFENLKDLITVGKLDN